LEEKLLLQMMIKTWISVVYRQKALTRIRLRHEKFREKYAQQVRQHLMAKRIQRFTGKYL
jgi:hypothetical protein